MLAGSTAHYIIFPNILFPGLQSAQEKHGWSTKHLAKRLLVHNSDESRERTISVVRLRRSIIQNYKVKLFTVLKENKLLPGSNRKRIFDTRGRNAKKDVRSIDVKAKFH